ncbi:unnamed protein product [Prunus armeniaca]|uniref:Uncharacterized protein n=1 Tax=Prunus armeniaca TaxID=36596 RepID=A0A6J5W2A6_PRUAR|nr:unnamed protein product [Prunus armeniaca]
MDRTVFRIQIQSGPSSGPRIRIFSFQSNRSNCRRSRVAKSPSATFDTCFFFENDGSGSALDSDDNANADPAYMSVFPSTGGFRSTIRTCFGIVISFRLRIRRLAVPQDRDFLHLEAPKVFGAGSLGDHYRLHVDEVVAEEVESDEDGDAIEYSEYFVSI